LNEIPQHSHEKLLLFKHAFRGNISTYIISGANHRDPEQFLNEVEDDIVRGTQHYLNQTEGVKVQLLLTMKLFQPTNTDKTTEGHFWSRLTPILKSDEVKDQIRSLFPKILQSHDNFIQKGSGWVDDKVIHLEINYMRYQPLVGSCNAKLPKNFKVLVAL